MCDPVSIGIGSLLVTAGGTALNVKAQSDAAKKQERANAAANARQQQVMLEELARQQGFDQEMHDVWTNARDRLTRDEFEAENETRALALLDRLAASGNDSLAPAPLLAGQERASSPVKEVIARQTQQAAAKTRQQIEAMAELNAYGGTGTTRAGTLSDSADMLDVLQGLRRGSLNAARQEELAITRDHPNHQPNPWMMGIGEIAAGAGQLGLGYAGQQYGLQQPPVPAPAPTPGMGRIY